MQGRRTGATYTNWENLLTKWSGNTRWWETDKDWNSLVCAAEEVSKRMMKRDMEGGNECHKMKVSKNEDDDNRKNEVHKERDTLRRWDLCCGTRLECRSWATRC